jgi:metal-responsive CopG/Arc/MetJ family transcriptional regulator
MLRLQEEKVEITLPKDLIRKIDMVREYLDAGSREAFIVAAVRRLVDQFLSLWWPNDPYQESR